MQNDFPAIKERLIQLLENKLFLETTNPLRGRIVTLAYVLKPSPLTQSALINALHNQESPGIEPILPHAHPLPRQVLLAKSPVSSRSSSEAATVKVPAKRRRSSSQFVHNWNGKELTLEIRARGRCCAASGNKLQITS